MSNVALVMVYGADGYRFLDFAKIGILLKVLLFIVSMICISYAWPFSSATRPFLNGSLGLDNEDFTSLHLPVFRRLHVVRRNRQHIWC